MQFLRDLPLSRMLFWQELNPLTDNQGRTINYMRISVTDLCNLRCLYCMPEEGVVKKKHSDILRVEEVEQIVRISAEFGINKIRLTGGEPLVRGGILDICRRIKNIPQIGELCLTTNGVLLEEMAGPLADAGVDRVNISLDTLDPAKYRSITRMGDLASVLGGIEAAKKANLTPVKLNVVLIGGFNDGEIEDFVNMTKFEDIEIRFIELMPIGPAAGWDQSFFLPAQTVLDRAPGLVPLLKPDGVATLYRLPGAKGSIGLISPISHRFCATCNRVRVTADGKFKGCLHSNEEIGLKNKTDEELRELIKRGILQKPVSHHLDESPGESLRNMNQIGG